LFYTFINVVQSIIEYYVLRVTNISAIIWLLHLTVHLRGERKAEKNGWHIFATEAIRRFRVSIARMKIPMFLLWVT